MLKHLSAKAGLKLAGSRFKWPKLAKISFSVVFVAVFSLMGISTVWAQDMNNSNLYIPSGTVYENVAFLAGENIDLNAHMKDDVYLAGANVVINGLVEGDVIAAGANITINSEIKGNVRVAGGSVTIRGNVGGNITVLCGNLTVDRNVEIGRNLLVGAGSAVIEGKINKNLYASASNIVINGHILGSAYLTVDSEGNVVLNPQTVINGNLEYTAAKAAEVKSGAQIQKEEKFHQLADFRPQRKAGWSAFFTMMWFISLLGAIVVGLVLIAVFKPWLIKISKMAESKIGLSILKGLIFLIVTPIALMILMVTIIGLPLAFIGLAIYLVLLYISKIILAVYVGERLIKLVRKQIKDVPLVWSMIIGVVILYILCLIPILGFLIRLVVVLWALGLIMTLVQNEFKLGNK